MSNGTSFNQWVKASIEAMDLLFPPPKFQVKSYPMMQGQTHFLGVRIVPKQKPNCVNCAAPLDFTKEKCNYCNSWIIGNK